MNRTDALVAGTDSPMMQKGGLHALMACPNVRKRATDGDEGPRPLQLELCSISISHLVQYCTHLVASERRCVTDN